MVMVSLVLSHPQRQSPKLRHKDFTEKNYFATKRVRRRARMAELGLMDSRAPGILQDQNAPAFRGRTEMAPYLTLMLP